jgi:hypothetical protein
LELLVPQVLMVQQAQLGHLALQVLALLVRRVPLAQQALQV